MTYVATYNGWTNRETWAVALWWNNDQGLYESIREVVRQARDDAVRNADEIVRDDDGNVSPSFIASRVGDAIKDEVEQTITVDGYTERTGADHLPAALSRIAEDIGSLYRVEWRELAEAWLSDIDE